MKTTIDIDCTPQEARQFLGLPDIGPMQEELIAELGQRLKAGLGTMEPEALMKTWLPAGLQGLEAAQKMFWSQMTASGGKAKTEHKDEE